jgi:hypothetical protein
VGARLFYRAGHNAGVRVSSVTLPSIHDLKPLEEGGPPARAGFLYQDHVAARFCIEMLRNPQLAEVWCETLDDITLIRTTAKGAETVEFVQVKSHDLSQMWSIALLCADGKKSIIAHSLAQHRCHEPCCFRVVTRTGVMAELSVLLLERDHQDRCVACAPTRQLHEELEKRLDGFYSDGGWSASAWAGSALWDVAESEQAIQDSNLLELERWLEEIGDPLLIDQRAELYSHILGRVVKASALTHEHAKKKKLLRGPYDAWARSEVNRLKGQIPTKAGRVLVGKMKTAQIAQAAIDNALTLRFAYRRRTLSPKYQQEDDYKDAEMELTAVLQSLLARLDAGLITMDGTAFHANCLNAADGIKEQFPKVGLSFLHGSMYTMTDRCRHRFLSAGVP